MRWLTALLVCFPAFAFADAPLSTDINQQADVGAPIQVENIVVYPLLSKVASSDEETEYATLDEALERGILVVEETSDSGDVNILHVVNNGGVMIFAMAGEVLLGGKQDRIVAKNTLIPERARRFGVDVFCVEHGRWQKKTEQFSSGKALVHTKLRASANKGSQEAVWAEVAKKNAELRTTNATDTYRATVKKMASSTKVGSVVDGLLGATRYEKSMAGLVVAINGELRAVDWFRSPRLYRKLERKLLVSYVTEALGAADGKKHQPPARKQARDFLTQAAQARVQRTSKAGKAKVYNFEDASVEGQLSRDQKDRVLHLNVMLK